MKVKGNKLQNPRSYSCSTENKNSLKGRKSARNKGHKILKHRNVELKNQDKTNIELYLTRNQTHCYSSYRISPH